MEVYPMKVKVGDKVRYNGIGGSNKELKKGNVYEVIALSTTMKDWIYVRSDKESIYDGSNASEKIAQPFTYLAENQYEVVKETPMAEIKPGDKVRLTDKFYEHEAFKSDKRYMRKQIASLAGREFKITAILFGRAHTATDIKYTIPIELLEKVEALPKNPKPGDLFKVINKGNGYHNFELGEVVEFVEVDRSGMYELRGYIKRKNEVGNQILYSSDLEPYDGKHRYTDEQIAEAEQIIGKIVASLPDWNNYAFSTIGRKTAVYENDDKSKGEDAMCRETDEYNKTIGRMIALCNHTGYKRPDWL
jgi:hypothetical protein